jgi:hypothetical protein
MTLFVWALGTKVFSIHLADDPPSVDPRYFRYQSGCCRVLSWDRGSWKDQIIVLPAMSREITQTFTSGLYPSGEGHPGNGRMTEALMFD